MRTTTRSSRPRRHRSGTHLPLATCHVLAALPLLSGCQFLPTPVDQLFQLAPESARYKAAQTRQFETPDETELLSASAAVLQDLGFQVVESEREIGYLRAVKERSAREYGQEIVRWIVAAISTAGVIGGTNTIYIAPVDLQQQIDAVLVTRPVDAKDSRHEVRVVFYRIVWKGDGQSGDNSIPPGQQRMEMIHSPEIYQQFFARLSKAVFLEAQRI